MMELSNRRWYRIFKRIYWISGSVIYLIIILFGWYYLRTHFESYTILILPTLYFGVLLIIVYFIIIQTAVWFERRRKLRNSSYAL